MVIWRLSPRTETNARLQVARLLRCQCRFDGRTHTSGVRAAVKTAVEKEQSRELQACIGLNRCATASTANILFCLTRYSLIAINA